jgi:hypothetical protein
MPKNHALNRAFRPRYRESPAEASRCRAGAVVGGAVVGGTVVGGAVVGGTVVGGAVVGGAVVVLGVPPVPPEPDLWDVVVAPAARVPIRAGPGSTPPAPSRIAPGPDAWGLAVELVVGPPGEPATPDAAFGTLLSWAVESLADPLQSGPQPPRAASAKAPTKAIRPIVPTTANLRPDRPRSALISPVAASSDQIGDVLRPPTRASGIGVTTPMAGPALAGSVVATPRAALRSLARNGRVSNTIPSSFDRPLQRWPSWAMTITGSKKWRRSCVTTALRSAGGTSTTTASADLEDSATSPGKAVAECQLLWARRRWSKVASSAFLETTTTFLVNVSAALTSTPTTVPVQPEDAPPVDKKADAGHGVTATDRNLFTRIVLPVVVVPGKRHWLTALAAVTVAPHDLHDGG